MPIDCTTVGMILFCLSKWKHKVTPSIMPGSTSFLPPFVQEEEKNRNYWECRVQTWAAGLAREHFFTDAIISRKSIDLLVELQFQMEKVLI